jgi:hypothetical protein
MVFRDKLIGGVPKDPRLIEGWLRARAGLEDAQEIRQAMLRTLGELGVEVQEDLTFEQLEQASAALAARKQTTGSKLGEHGLYVEARQIKAMLKESTNVLFGGERWGSTRKGPRSFVAERVFVEPDKLWLGVDEPSGVELMIGHLWGPGGAQHTRLPGVRRTARARVHRDGGARCAHARAMGRYLGACPGEWLWCAALARLRLLLC